MSALHYFLLLLFLLTIANKNERKKWTYGEPSSEAYKHLKKVTQPVLYAYIIKTINHYSNV